MKAPNLEWNSRSEPDSVHRKSFYYISYFQHSGCLYQGDKQLVQQISCYSMQSLNANLLTDSSVASFPALLCLQFLIACSMQKWSKTVCKRSKTGGVEGLGTRLLQRLLILDHAVVDLTEKEQQAGTVKTFISKPKFCGSWCQQFCQEWKRELDPHWFC